MHVALDGTPLLGRRTGIGRYTEHLLTALAELASDPDDRRCPRRPSPCAAPARCGRRCPPGCVRRSLPVPARLLRAVWTHLRDPAGRPVQRPRRCLPRTNFVLPPTGRAGGVVTVHDLAFLTMPDTVDATSRAAARAGAAQPGSGRRGLHPDVGRSPIRCWTPTGRRSPRCRHPAGRRAGAGSTPRRPIPGSGAELGLPADYFLFVGTREPRKDLATLLAAYAAVPVVLVRRHPSRRRCCWSGRPAGDRTSRPAAGVLIRGYAPTGELRRIVAAPVRW